MSEYQHYEFRSIDKALSEEEREIVSSWSSRTRATSIGATFTYHYSDFPKNARQVVERYFDAMFYLSNWGSYRLMFKVPKGLFTLKSIRQYCSESLEIYESADFIIIDICVNEEDGECWAEGDGMLSSLISLREDIIAGDFRSLYLIWLKESTEDVINEYDNVDENSDEPDVPAGLAELNGALTEFANVFNVDQDAISAAAMASMPLKPIDVVDYSTLIEKLNDKEKTEWLVRLINNESNLAQKFKRTFSKHKLTKDAVMQKRSVSDIVEIMMRKREEREVIEKQLREEKRLAKLQKVERKQDSLWEDVDHLISLKKSNAYDQAVKNLELLKELAVHKNTLSDFTKKVTAIKHQNSNLRALQSRIDYAKLC